jgi:hypothetical protein
MKRGRHTPGPWFAVGYQVEIESETVADICTTNAHLFGQPGLHDDARAMANARLIAAAPEMLATLEALVISHRALCNSPEWDEQDEAEQAQARAIIAYAKGELK